MRKLLKKLDQFLYKEGMLTKYVLRELDYYKYQGKPLAENDKRKIAKIVGSNEMLISYINEVINYSVEDYMTDYS